MKLPTFKKGGIHVPEHKTTPADHIVKIELPRKVAILLKQHIGLPALPIVKKGDKVLRGQKIAEAQGRVSAPMHASISGTVEMIGPVTTLSGQIADAIVISANDAEHEADEIGHKIFRKQYDWKHFTPEEVIAIIADNGIVGLGGATFPCAIKLSPPPNKKAEMLIINAAECEPYLTCDDALMRYKPDDIINGIEIMMYASKCQKAVVGIEDNKPLAYDALRKAAESHPNIEIRQLKTKYPQGGEKQLIQAITGKEVPSGGLPIDVGAIVQNVATAFAVYRAVAERVPLIEKVVTIVPYGNYLVPIGMYIDELPIDTKGEEYEEADVIIGGPMMGRSAASLSVPFEKGTSGVTPVKPLKYKPQPCIRCGACVQACPMGLEPYLVSTYGRLRRTADAVEYGAMDCIECGSCNYSCPSGRPIVEAIRLAKTAYRNTPKK